MHPGRPKQEDCEHKEPQEQDRIVGAAAFPQGTPFNAFLLPCLIPSNATEEHAPPPSLQELNAACLWDEGHRNGLEEDRKACGATVEWAEGREFALHTQVDWV